MLFQLPSAVRSNVIGRKHSVKGRVVCPKFGRPVWKLSMVGVQKTSKIVIIGSILITRFAVGRLDKNKHFSRRKKKSKKCVQNFGWALKKWSKMHLLSFFWATIWQKRPRQKRWVCFWCDIGHFQTRFLGMTWLVKSCT